MGMYLIIGGYFAWNWFMKTWNDLDLTYFIGRTGARISYIILGFVLIAVGILFVTGVIKK
jgi:hypothetical protein